ncbi:hypothetical protein [Faecalibaculum rodentium]|uniref:hypothetical protein n=1 Tax=Faecalibaculum rodentium TaxID=1702221 RepID=UPI0025742F08|nr:hypothetical protein [Faecalibaculum rodentium]
MESVPGHPQAVQIARTALTIPEPQMAGMMGWKTAVIVPTRALNQFSFFPEAAVPSPKLPSFVTSFFTLAASVPITICV